ncbi:MAG TPA: thiamine pyrophosphate-dependent enzyme [Ramlibacter sp.]|uniref:thiamine pyrophosphate-dependent enzyme n=1 Tax=Ramlibacter sp. TaxID=1917967 RepID=UPI002C24D87D|nr:thiamine pyrophosphate-dependent enzyme [Ramlibacter sp.]HVZ44886.1 thiamine pyrophosphate-dependent enzyme [Ramlibacter sp.]
MKPLYCEEACRIVAGIAQEDVLIITMSTMKTLPGIAPNANFVSCVPLMGGSASLGLGVAAARPDVRVWVLDGDASLLMELGSLVTVAEAMPKNFVHLLFNNSVQYGGTANLAIPQAGKVDFCGMARAAGYRRVMQIDSAEELQSALAALPPDGGPVFASVRVEPDAPYYSAATPQREIPDNQITRMGDEARRVRAVLAATTR